MILGKQDNIYFAPPFTGNTEELDEALDKFFSLAREDMEAVVVTDLLGGSVNTRIAQRGDHRFTLVTGVNLGLVLELAVAGPRDSIVEVVDRARGGTQIVELTAHADEEDF